jgi:hypothetical protein
VKRLLLEVNEITFIAADSNPATLIAGMQPPGVKGSETGVPFFHFVETTATNSTFFTLFFIAYVKT